MKRIKTFFKDYGFVIYPVIAMFALVIMLAYMMHKSETSITKELGKAARELKIEFDKGYNDTK